MSQIVIYHNPRCSKSRLTLSLLEEKSNDIEVIKYLETPPSTAQLEKIISLLGFNSARQLMRRSEDIYKALNLHDEQSEQVLLNAMVNHPKLIERPIVLSNGKAAIGRPPESVLDIL